MDLDMFSIGKYLGLILTVGIIILNVVRMMPIDLEQIVEVLLF